MITGFGRVGGTERLPGECLSVFGGVDGDVMTEISEGTRVLVKDKAAEETVRGTVDGRVKNEEFDAEWCIRVDDADVLPPDASECWLYVKDDDIVEVL